MARILLRKIDTISAYQLPVKGRSAPEPNTRSFLKRDVLKKEFSNPYRKKRVRLPIFQWMSSRRLRITQIACLSITITWFGFLFFKTTFYYDSVSVKGAKDVPAETLEELVNEQISKRSWLLIRRSHMLFFRSEPLAKAINDLVSVEEVRFERDWSTRSVTVHIKEKLSTVLLGYKDEFYSLDNNGLVIRSVAPDEAAARKLDTPIIYDYTEQKQPQLGESYLSPSAVQNVLVLYQELKKYPDLHIHSFRLKPVEAKEVRIPEQLPSSQSKPDEEGKELDSSLDDLARNIAQAQTTAEKLDQLQSALNDLEIQKIREGEAIKYLETEKVYVPDGETTFSQLEVYMHEGWSLKLGHQPVEHLGSLEQPLKIFATLNNKISIKEEVREYIDLRFPNRVYYR